MLFTRVVHESRARSFSLLLRVWALVAIYAVLHDQYLIRIAPEHFTVYHRPLGGIQSLTLLAAAWAYLASLGPGFLLGIACLVTTTAGSWPPLPRPTVLRSVVVVLVATEACSALAGVVVFVSGRGIFPASFYVDGALPLLVTQTIQITCYGIGGLFSGIMLVRVVFLRKRAAVAAETGNLPSTYAGRR